MQGKINYVLLVIFVVLVLGAVGIGARLITSEPTRGPNAFPAEDYLKNPKNFIDNKYEIQVQIKGLIHSQTGKGKIMEVTPINSKDIPLLVFIPAGQDMTLHVGQRYSMQVVVDERGLLRVSSLEKN